jgi:hypothetical protein
LTPCCGLEVQNPTQTLKSDKNSGNTFGAGDHKFPKDGKVLFHFGFESKILLVPLTDLSVIGGILYLKPTAVCQISTLIFGFLGGSGNTLELNPKWEITLLFCVIFSWDMNMILQNKSK